MRFSRQAAPIAPVAVGALMLWYAFASPQVASPIPHRAPVAQKPTPLYQTLKLDFSSGRYGPYQVVSSDPVARTIVVTRNHIDSAHWTRWAYCRMDPIEMLSSLRDGAVRLTIKLEPTTPKNTYAVVSAEFSGSYGLGATNKSLQCASTGVLEEDVLREIGASVH